MRQALSPWRKRAFIDYTESNVLILSSRQLLLLAASMSLAFYGTPHTRFPWLSLPGSVPKSRHDEHVLAAVAASRTSAALIASKTTSPEWLPSSTMPELSLLALGRDGEIEELVTSE
jgi:hypothetical protein